MNESSLHFALRETRRLLRTPKMWALSAAIAVLLGISAPFDTGSLLRLGPRITYWFVVVTVTFCMGFFIHHIYAQMFLGRSANKWLHIIAAGFASGVAALAALLLINWAALGVFPIEAGYTLLMAVNVIMISIVVSFIIGMIENDTPAGKPPRAITAKILHRLELNKRGTLISLSVHDHYVEVTTSAGTSLLLMRLSDAIAETAGIEGQQVHRSHWVATKQVATCKRTGKRAGDKTVITLRDGRDIPVSRTYIKAIRDAGLLPD